MRRLQKGPIPEVLSANSEEWTRAYQEFVTSGKGNKAPWRHQDIVEALRAEVLDKCAYCEAVIADVAAPNVEHIAPKVRFADRVVDWANLTLACPKCNQHKGSYHSDSKPLMNPYTDEPADHFNFAGPAILSRPADDVALVTIERLKLMRPQLILERAKRIELVSQAIDRWAREGDPELRQLYAEMVWDELADDVEFVASLRAFADLVGFAFEGGTTLTP